MYTYIFISDLDIGTYLEAMKYWNGYLHDMYFSTFKKKIT